MSESADIQDDFDLFNRLAKGEKTAFERIFRRYKEKVYGVSKLILKDPFLAEEATQELFIRLWQKKERFKNTENPEAYLFRMTRNTAIDLFRRETKEQSSRDRIEEKLREQQFILHVTEEKELEKLLQEAIHLLPEKRRDIFLLSRNKDISYDELAKRAGVSRNTVKTHLLLAVRDIKSFLEQHRYLSWLLGYYFF